MRTKGAAVRPARPAADRAVINEAVVVIQRRLGHNDDVAYQHMRWAAQRRQTTVVEVAKAIRALSERGGSTGELTEFLAWRPR